ncbi:2OG-Fe(II) oxygenase [Alteromonas halophila]|uniref:2OG-Fe(II) oxygenase n=1 Tax=Alteromonas halophila TaxID=516698 RepID=A0A918JIL1_9ALTE|nr:2OG-Fe(II) oxygenase [Alteromonas halophila]GGW82663.1 hypothetical protein GCM10007391_14710 [Alteromonas halophila]
MALVNNNALFSSKRLSVNLVTYHEGHRVLEHNDPMGSGRYFKFNVVLKKPQKGGVFYAERVIFRLFDRIYLFRPDKYLHRVSRIEKGKRTLLSIALWL